MKMRNKGKVHPFTSSSSSPSPSPSPTGNTDPFSLLKLLPAAILTLISFLSPEEREVLAYMITRSLKSSSLPTSEDKMKAVAAAKKQQCGHNSPALFDCDCFHCYTSFWLRWDSSPKRELIHQAIEAFEDHLNSSESFKNSAKTKRRDKLGRWRNEKNEKTLAEALDSSPPENQELALSTAATTEVEAALVELDELGPGIEGVSLEKAVEEDCVSPAAVVRTHKGLARKVLPDVMGIFSSRLWSLWSPNV